MVATLEEALAWADTLAARQVPYDELGAALDQCLTLPGSDNVRAAIEHRRLAACQNYRRPVEECESVLIAFRRIEPSPVRRAAASLAACASYPEIAARYLGPLIAELEADDPAQEADTREALKSVLASAYKVRARLGLDTP